MLLVVSAQIRVWHAWAKLGLSPSGERGASHTPAPHSMFFEISSAINQSSNCKITIVAGYNGESYVNLIVF